MDFFSFYFLALVQPYHDVFFSFAAFLFRVLGTGLDWKHINCIRSFSRGGEVPGWMSGGGKMARAGLISFSI
jgi:hypothetical protein